MSRYSPVKLKGAVVAVTGGARGIGLAIAEALKTQGAQVSIGDLDVVLAKKEAKRLGTFAHKLDVRSSESFAEFLRATENELGPIDILINNAGIMPLGAFLEESMAITDAQIDINFRGIIYGMKLALPSMLYHRSGHIINIASLAGRFAIPGAAIYSGTKHAVVGLTEALAGEHRDSGVHFTVIMPSKVLTELSSGTNDADAGIPAVTPPKVAEAVISAIKKPRLFIAVPNYLQTAHGLYEMMPEWLKVRGRRLMGDTGVLTNLDLTARKGYDKRLAGLLRKKTT